MTRQPIDPTTSDTLNELRELCFGGDWACADGNLGTLLFVMQRIASAAPEPVQARLLGIAELCLEHPEHAVAIWLRLKDNLLSRHDQLAS